MPQTTNSDITPTARAATLRITAGGKRIFSRAITPATADAVLQEAQAALDGHNGAVLELDTAGADEELQRVKSGSADAWLFIQAGLDSLPSPGRSAATILKSFKKQPIGTRAWAGCWRWPRSGPNGPWPARVGGSPRRSVARWSGCPRVDHAAVQQVRPPGAPKPL